MPETEISIKGLTKSFGPQTVLEDITFDIPKGKITLILGPSGTGKSVFLKHLVGLLRPDRGEVWVGDKNVPALREKELYEVRRKFGVLFQDGALFGSMNIFDNVAFPLAPAHPQARVRDQEHRQREAHDGGPRRGREEAPRRDLGRDEEEGRPRSGSRARSPRSFSSTSPTLVSTPCARRS